MIAIIGIFFIFKYGVTILNNDLNAAFNTKFWSKVNGVGKPYRRESSRIWRSQEPEFDLAVARMYFSFKFIFNQIGK